MIDISKLTEADKNKDVKYAMHGGCEIGRIVSWTNRFVFVRYHVREITGPIVNKWIPLHGGTAKATRAEDLEWL